MAGGDWQTSRVAASRRCAGCAARAVPARIVERLHAAIENLHRMPHPVIGACARRGRRVRAVARLRRAICAVAADDAYFTSAYRQLGLTPDGGGTWALPRHRRAAQGDGNHICFPSASTPHEALRIGIVNRVVAGAGARYDRERDRRTRS